MQHLIGVVTPNYLSNLNGFFTDGYIYASIGLPPLSLWCSRACDTTSHSNATRPLSRGNKYDFPFSPFTTSTLGHMLYFTSLQPCSPSRKLENGNPKFNAPCSLPGFQTHSSLRRYYYHVQCSSYAYTGFGDLSPHSRRRPCRSFSNVSARKAREVEPPWPRRRQHVACPYKC